MNRLPLLIADWFAFYRHLPGHPRQVLLNRAHSPGSTLLIVVLALMDLLAVHPYTTEVLCTALVIGGPSSLAATAGACFHVLWKRGLIWADLECQWCTDDPDDDDGDDEPTPDDPDDDGGLIRDIEAWLRTELTCTH